MPGCVSQALPQAQRARTTFREDDLAIVGLHTVFEHHEAQGSATALEAFLHECRIKFPVGIDAQENGSPVTMRTYGMRGTPTTLLYDRAGQLRLHQFGHIEDMALGASIVVAMASEAQLKTHTASTTGACGPEGCKP